MTFGLSSVGVRFGDIAALDDVTLSAEPGSITIVAGGDGAGKTTVLRALVGNVEPSTGTVHRPPPEHIGYLPTGGGSWRTLTVHENVQFVGRSYGLSPTEIATRGGRLLAHAGLWEAKDRLAGQLSGGMRKKLGFCLAMLSEPDLLVLDEPTTGVDPVSRVELWRLVSETAASGATVVMATTYMDEAERASMVYLLDRGRLLLKGPPDELIARMPGQIARSERPVDATRAWRVGTSFHEWWGSGAPDGAVLVDQSLEDVAIVARLASSLPAGRTAP